MQIDKSKMKDGLGKPLTQSLFLEPIYNPAFALYTMKDADHVYEGVSYPSIKRLYLEMEDVTEYEFANAYFLGWNHWLRLLDNKLIRLQIDTWRDELEIKLRARAIRAMIKQADEGNYQASKWLADRQWITRAAGRPNKLEIEAEKSKVSRVNDEFSADIIRLKTK